jgi:hypothetical protein
MAPAALALSAAGVDFGALKYRLSAAREGWISFLEMLPPRGIDEWFVFLLSKWLDAPVCAWLESRAPLGDKELIHAACRAGSLWDRRDAVKEVMVKRFKSGLATESVWCPFLEGLMMKRSIFGELEIRAWLAAGCNVNCRGDNGATLLMRTAFSVYGVENENVLAALIKAGADVNLQNSSGKTVLMRAVKYDCSQGIDVLVAAGANLNLQMNDGQTALSIALTKSYNSIVWQLLDAGAEPLTAFQDLEAVAAWKGRHPRSSR